MDVRTYITQLNTLNLLLSKLRDVPRYIIQRNYGIHAQRQTLSAIAHDLELTTQRVMVIRDNALRDMRTTALQHQISYPTQEGITRPFNDMTIQELQQDIAKDKYQRSSEAPRNTRKITGVSDAIAYTIGTDNPKDLRVAFLEYSVPLIANQDTPASNAENEVDNLPKTIARTLREKYPDIIYQTISVGEFNNNTGNLTQGHTTKYKGTFHFSLRKRHQPTTLKDMALDDTFLQITKDLNNILTDTFTHTTLVSIASHKQR